MAEDFFGGGQVSSPSSVMMKMILLGDGGVGKSSLMTRYVNDEFDPSCAHTVGVEFLKKEVKAEKMTYVLQIWDTAGQERFRSLRTPFYRGSDVCLLIYSVDNRKSFDNLKMWMGEFLKHTEVEDPREFPFVIVGNKADSNPEKERIVKRSEAEDWCCRNGPFPYLETSAKDSLNVQEAFETAVRSWKNLNKAQAEAAAAVLAEQQKIAERNSSKKKKSSGKKSVHDSVISPISASPYQVLTQESTTIKLGKKQKSTDLAVGGRSSGCC